MGTHGKYPPPRNPNPDPQRSMYTGDPDLQVTLPTSIPTGILTSNRGRAQPYLIKGTMDNVHYLQSCLQRFNLFESLNLTALGAKSMIMVLELSVAYPRGFQKFNRIPGVKFFILLGFAEPTNHMIQAHFYIRKL